MQRKIFITYTIFLFIGIILTGVLTLSFIRVGYLENIENQLISNGNLINEFVKEKALEKSFDDIDFSEIAHRYGEKTNTRITFLDERGFVIGDSKIKKEDLYKVEPHSHRIEIQRALGGKVGKSKRTSVTLDADYLYIAIPIIINKEIKGITRLAYSLTEINNMNYRLLQNYLIAGFCGLFVTTILGYRYVNNVTKPIREITKTAKKIANGDFKNRVYIKSNDEIGILVENFNIMAEKLNLTITEMQDKNIKLQSTLTSMGEGLFAVDKSYKIILINPVAMKWFNTQDENVYGKHILEVIRNNKLHDALKDIIENNDIGQREITIDYPEHKILKVHTNLIRLDKDPNRVIGVMALLQDVTEMRNLENMRSEFVANVSHELKTPLTSIAGFIETLKGGAIDNKNVRDRFLNIIEIEAERLRRLIDDLLSLSSIENHRVPMVKEEIIIHEVLQEINFMVEGLVKQKEIIYHTEIESGLPVIYGNHDWFKQMILNLIENGIKYTPEGGTVKVLIHQRQNYIFIRVKDTGIGIPKQDIPRLFERFYRVDKARSRKVGGTGLGLAIVKHIVFSFKGEIKVNSELGKGSEFVVRIPI